jgi:hypothetical protein
MAVREQQDDEWTATERRHADSFVARKGDPGVSLSQRWRPRPAGAETTRSELAARSADSDAPQVLPTAAEKPVDRDIAGRDRETEVEVPDAGMPSTIDVSGGDSVVRPQWRPYR